MYILFKPAKMFWFMKSNIETVRTMILPVHVRFLGVFIWIYDCLRFRTNPRVPCYPLDIALLGSLWAHDVFVVGAFPATYR